MVNDNLPYRFVFVFGLLFGGSLVFVVPPFGVPDELAHFHRAYHCSQGKLYATQRGGVTGDGSAFVVDRDLRGDCRRGGVGRAVQDVAGQVRQDRRHGARSAAAAVHALSEHGLVQPGALFAAIRRDLGRAFWEPAPLAMFYLARVANLIAYLLVATTAVRLAPIHKWTLALVALMPMSVFLAASLSADAVTIGLSLLVVALTLNLALGSKRPSRRSFLALGVLLALLALSKQAYVGLSLLFFVIPATKFSSPGRRWLIAGLMIGLPLAIDAAWTYSLRELYVPMYSYVNPQGQFHWILHHPWSYMATMFKAIYRLETYSHVIGVFGWMGKHLPLWICGTYWAALGFTAVLDGGRPLPLSVRAKAIALGVYLFTAAMMVTLVYLSWEREGSKGTEGIQPRYFLPIVPLLLLLPRGGAKLVSSRFSRIVVPVIAMLTTVLATGATWWTLRYYW